MALGHHLSSNTSQPTQFKHTSTEMTWDPPEQFKIKSQNITCVKRFSLPLERSLRHSWSAFPMQKRSSPCYHDYTRQLVFLINHQIRQIFHKNVCCNTSCDGEDKARTDEAKKATMATKAATTQEQRLPQSSTPVVLVHLQHRTREHRFGGKGVK